MLQKIVKAKMIFNGEEIEILILISCVPSTPDNELIRRAGNILRKAVDEATYKV